MDVSGFRKNLAILLMLIAAAVLSSSILSLLVGTYAEPETSSYLSFLKAPLVLHIYVLVACVFAFFCLVEKHKCIFDVASVPEPFLSKVYTITGVMIVLSTLETVLRGYYADPIKTGILSLYATIGIALIIISSAPICSKAIPHGTCHSVKKARRIVKSGKNRSKA